MSDKCRNCGGQGYFLKSSNGVTPCNRCNGTGIEGDPLKGLAVIIGFNVVFLWVVYRVLTGLGYL